MLRTNRFHPVPFTYERTLHFPDTDAAGVVFFANYLVICHEAYEEALAAAGLSVRTFFSNTEVMVPVSKSSADYLRPLYCGDKVRVSVTPMLLNENSFAIEYDIVRLGTSEKLAGHVRTAHICLNSTTRERAALPPALLAWIQAS
jgi:1,4-dihydroxy-2-naphthoyl-CoA hydrolase